MSLSLEHGALLVQIARKTIGAQLLNKDYKPSKVPASFKESRGIFVTLETHPDKELRGCIGFPEPMYPLIKAVQEAAASAAIRDPRFPAVQPDELQSLVIEITVLTPPQQIQPPYPKQIEIGKDGLIVEQGLSKGLLLPQVPFHFSPSWDAEEFLTQTCHKAGLPGDAWKSGKAKVYTFQGQIFAEKEPNGIVIEKEFK